jgi:hypothetical protein
LVTLPDAPPAKQQRTSDEDVQGDLEAAGRGRREETLSVLFRHRVIAKGTEIEPMPQALPADNSGSAPDIFRVRIGRPPGREVVWAVDNKPYSLTPLSIKLSEEHGLVWFRGRTFELWRLVGRDESLWDMAERLVRQEAEQRG